MNKKMYSFPVCLYKENDTFAQPFAPVCADSQAELRFLSIVGLNFGFPIQLVPTFVAPNLINVTAKLSTLYRLSYECNIVPCFKVLSKLLRIQTSAVCLQRLVLIQNQVLDVYCWDCLGQKEYLFI